MPKVCKINNLVSKTLAISIQVGFIFSFLTIFFFVYVQKVEKREFKEQVEFIIDNIFDDVKADLPKVIKNSVDDQKELIIINGIIDVIEDKIRLESKTNNDKINKENKKIEKKAFTYLIYTLIFILALIIIFTLMKYCLPIVLQVKEAMVIVIFVAITEFLFLQIIARNYISASPNNIKKEIGKTIKIWIKNNKG